MRRIYHPYWDWEDFKAGMWRKVSSDEEAPFLCKAVSLTGDHVLYGSFMLRIAREWPISCEHNLSEVGMNRRAWIGHAAVCLAIQCPEYITRRAWWILTEEQRQLADAQADNAIEFWIHSRESRQMRFDFA